MHDRDDEQLGILQLDPIHIVGKLGSCVTKFYIKGKMNDRDDEHCWHSVHLVDGKFRSIKVGIMDLWRWASLSL